MRRHYGQSIIANKLDLKEDDEEVQILFDKMYASFVEGRSVFLDHLTIPVPLI